MAAQRPGKPRAAAGGADPALAGHRLVDHAQDGGRRQSNAIRVPKVGRPVMKARVPSIGSSTQRIRASGRSRPNSSPSTPCSGNRSVSTARIACSAVRSAMVTGERSAFRSAPSPARKNGRTTAPATSAAASAAAISRSISAGATPELAAVSCLARWHGRSNGPWYADGAG